MKIFKKILQKSKNYIYYIKQLLKYRNIDKLMDQGLIWSVVFSFLAVVLYKVLINLEVLLFQTHTLVLPDVIKDNLAFVYFIFLCVWILIKFYFYVRAPKSNENDSSEILRKETPKAISLKVLGKRFSINSKILYIIAVIGILTLSILIKVKYADLPFVGSQPMKYSTYAEPAFHMYENNDPLFFRRNYMYNPLKPSEASAQVFGNLPLMEWLLYTGYSLLGKILSIETITRLTTALLGAIALLSMYVFTSKFINKKVALATILLFSFNPIFNLASYVTVYDIITFSFTFFSLSFLLDFLEKEDFKKLAIAGLLIGIGASVKTNILIWTLPIMAIFLLSKYRHSIKDLCKSGIYYCLWAILPLITVQTSLTNFPSKNIWYFIFFIAEVAVIIFLYFKQKYIKNILQSICKSTFLILNKFKFLYLLVIPIVVLSVVYVYSTDLSEEFLTDSKLIFNADLYRYMIENQLIPYINIFLTILFIYSLPLLITLKDSAKRWGLIALFSGIIFYILIASKVLFFHNYYWVIIIAPVYILVMIGIFYISKIIQDKRIHKIFISVMLFTQIALLLPTTVSKINRNDKDILEMVNYFQSLNLEDGISYIDEASSNYLLFKTNLNTIYSYEIFDNEQLQQKVQEIGFIETMKYYKILYIIVPTGSIPDYLPIANVYDTEDILIENSIRRTDKILDTLYETNHYYPLAEERNNIIKKYHLDKTYHVVEIFGKYAVFSLIDACLAIEE